MFSINLGGFQADLKGRSGGAEPLPRKKSKYFFLGLLTEAEVAFLQMLVPFCLLLSEFSSGIELGPAEGDLAFRVTGFTLYGYAVYNMYRHVHETRMRGVLGCDILLDGPHILQIRMWAFGRTSFICSYGCICYSHPGQHPGVILVFHI